MRTQLLLLRRAQDQGSLSAVEEHITAIFVVNLRVFAETMVNAVLAKCTMTHGHSQRVGAISYTAALGFGLKRKQADYYYIAGLLHDVVKIGLTDTILAKMNPHESLTAEEESALRRHPTIGAQVIEPLDRTMSSSDSLCSIIMHRMMEAVIPAGGVQCRFRLGLALSGALML